MSNRINHEENKNDVYFQIDRARSKMNKDTFGANTLLRQNVASNDNPKKFGGGHRPTENRYGHDKDVQGSKRRKINGKLAKPKFISGR